ncbi:MAG: hypothetical protein ACOY0T_31535 [Myxococcota bacterium]
MRRSIVLGLEFGLLALGALITTGCPEKKQDAAAEPKAAASAEIGARGTPAHEPDDDKDEKEEKAEKKEQGGW